MKKEKVFNTVCYNRLIVGYTVSTKLIGFSHHGVARGNDCSDSGLLMLAELRLVGVRMRTFIKEVICALKLK